MPDDMLYDEAHDLWVVRSHKAVVAAANDPDSFTSSGTWPGARRLCPMAQRVASRAVPVADTLLSSDPPKHGRYRRISQKAFSPRRVESMRPYIEHVVGGLLDAMKPQPEVEFVAGFSTPLPVRVIAGMLGVPDELTATFKHWADDLALSLSADITDEEQVRTSHTLLDFQAHFVSAIEDRRRTPRDDLLSELANGPGVDEETALTMPELMSLCQQLIVAGQETTTTLLTGMLWFLSRDDELQERLRLDPDTHTRFIEESLRHLSPVLGRYRIVTEDVVVGGVDVPRGARVQLNFEAGNHDPAFVADPDEFSIEREGSTRHLAFGIGPHFCLGAPLARLEAQLALEAVLSSTSHIRMISPPVPRPHFHLRGFDSLALEMAWR